MMVTGSVVKLVNADKQKPIFFPGFSKCGPMRADLDMITVHFSSVLALKNLIASFSHVFSLRF